MGKQIKIRILDAKSQTIDIGSSETVVSVVQVKTIHDYSGTEKAEMNTSKIAVITENTTTP